ncbi:MAG: hypothetical protein HY699_15290 [Deltaproteobacteria bacterium]|nr:hypothetical protein [Deltaproteobacteria bacterium]
MKSERLTDAQVRALGWEALVEKLGPTGALRFSIQTQGGNGDYAELRQRTLGPLSVDQLLARMRSSSKTARPRPRRRQRP